MWLLTLIVLILLGVLGIAPWLKARRPDTSQHLRPLEQAEGWIGVAGLVLGILLLLRWLSALQLIQYAPGSFLVGLVNILVILATALLLGLPRLRSLFGSGQFTTKLGTFAERLHPYRIGLGFACLVLALYMLLARL